MKNVAFGYAKIFLRREKRDMLISETILPSTTDETLLVGVRY